MSKINNKSCIDKLVEHFNPIVSPDFEFPVYKDEKEENEEIPDKISCLLGHLSRRSYKQKSRRLSRRWKSLTKTGIRCYRCLTWVSSFITHFNRGKHPSFPQVYNMKVMRPVEFEVPSIVVLLETQLD